METGTCSAKRIDIFTPTIRHDGLKIVQACLERQTFKYFRWVIVDKHYDLKWARENLSEKLDIVYLPEKAQVPRRKYGIMNGRNTPIPFFTAPLIVEIQDYHWFPKHTLEQFWIHYIHYPMDLFSAYYSICDFTNYEKAIEAETLTDEDVNVIDRTIRAEVVGKDYIIQSMPYPCMAYEMNISSIPLSVLRNIAPLDEEFDNGYQQDPHLIALRAMMQGSDIYITPMIHGYSFEHKILEPRPVGHQKDALRNQERLRKLFPGFYP